MFPNTIHSLEDPPGLWESPSRATRPGFDDPVKKPQVYLGGPFFNPPQAAIMAAIEGIMEMQDYPYFSPRIHTDSRDFTPEQRKDPDVWDPVFEQNIKGMLASQLLLAVVEYALPEGQRLALCREIWTEEDPLLPTGDVRGWRPQTFLDIPDTGTTWEMGLAYGYGKPTVAFLPSGKERMNLMLAKSTVGFINGWEALERWLSPREGEEAPGLSMSEYFSMTAGTAQNRAKAYRETSRHLFDWSAVTHWQGAIF